MILNLDVIENEKDLVDIDKLLEESFIIEEMQDNNKDENEEYEEENENGNNRDEINSIIDMPKKKSNSSNIQNMKYVSD